MQHRDREEIESYAIQDKVLENRDDIKACHKTGLGQKVPKDKR